MKMNVRKTGDYHRGQSRFNEEVTVSHYTCPALGGVSADPKDLCSEKLDPENLCCFSCGKKDHCEEVCMKIAEGQQSCGTLVK